MRRRMLASIGGWKNPYITDGLIAMWDGEWNAGGGVHSSNPEVWKDLAGNADMYREGNGNYIWNANNIDLTGGIAYANHDRAFTKSEVVTMEAVFLYHNFSASNVGTNDKLFNLGATSPYLGYNMQVRLVVYRSDSMTLAFKAASFDSERVHGFSPNKNTVYSCSQAFNTDGHTAYMYKNGVSQSTRSTKGSAASNYLSCYAEGFKGLTGLLGRVYCVRAYNRNLAAAEVLANYAIDKDRFGLP